MVLRVNCKKTEKSAVQFMDKKDMERAAAFSVNEKYIHQHIKGTVERTIFIKSL
jgi:hypothetical protein